MEKICSNCEFWVKHPKYMHGDCHRYPPLSSYSSKSNEYKGIFYRTHSMDWCGEYKPKELSISPTHKPKKNGKKINEDSPV